MEILNFKGPLSDLIHILKKGGSIHIKKKNRGKFTESAKRAGMGVQEYARHVLANKDKYSSTLVKRAAFAKGIGGSQIKKHKHENGGTISKFQPGGVVENQDFSKLNTNWLFNLKPTDFRQPNQYFRAVEYDSDAELNWNAEDWLNQRAENDRGPKYTEKDIEIFNSHVPEYKEIERTAKENGTWLNMPDGSKWVGDPREWVIMQSKAFKKNYQENPWYTGQAEWPTQVTLPDGTTVNTDKVKRARYHNGEMWFSDDAGYAQYFADTVGRGGIGVRGQFINPNYETDHKIKGTVFLAGIPKEGNFRRLEGPTTGYDYWRNMPFELLDDGIKRINGDTNLLTDDLVEHSRKLGDDGLFLFNVNDGPVIRNKFKDGKMLPYFARPGNWTNTDPNSKLENVPINEFISQPGFTEKIKFIKGNNGNFDPNTDDKYSAIFKTDSPLLVKQGGILKAQHGLPEGLPTYMIPQPLSPLDIALKQAKASAKNKTHLPPGVKEVIGPDGQKIAIRTEQPLVPMEQSIAEWLPGTGDVAEIGYIANDVKNGNYGTAALAAAMIAIPGNVGKVLRKSDVPVSKSTKVVVKESKPHWTNTSQSKLTEAERLGIPRGERNQPLNGHLKGDKAVQMFKEYGIVDFPENSAIRSQIEQLVPEARERYGLVKRTDITDEEIAGSLYKRALELNGEGNAAIWETGEPRLLFRGDTRRYNKLIDKWSPEKLAKGKGTMDNSLGNLFLGDISGKGQGVDRYFISGTDFFDPIIQGSATGARGKFGTILDSGGEGLQGTNIPYIPKDAYKLTTYQTHHGPYSLYKFPGKYSESGISDLNPFVVRTPAMRDATGEISVLADDYIMKTKNYRGPDISDFDGPTYDGVNSTVRDAMAKHYQTILDDAQSKGQGLLFSEGLTDEYIKKFGEIHPFRREHERYDYYALPNFNRQNVKHLFGWDLRKPIQWDVDNIYLEQGGKL